VHRTRLSLALGSLLAACALAACAWSVPADPGLVAECRPCRPGCSSSRDAAPAIGAPPVPLATPAKGAPPPSRRGDDGARTLYVAHCSRCHAAFPPTHASAAEWPVFVRKYGPRAGLFGADRERVLAWLQANAR